MNSRPLPFPLDYSATDSALTPIGEELPPLPAFPADSDEKIALVFEMSLNEFVKIASAIDVGNDIAYPEDSVGIWYIWSRAIMSDSLCALVAACIDSPTSATRAALNRYITNATTRNLIAGMFPQLTPGLGQGLPPDETILTSSLGLGSNPSCDLDVLWSQCLAVVTTLSTALLDLMQNIEVASNIVELGNAVISSVPILSALAETMGANGWLDLVNYFQTAWQEGFEAGYTETPGGTRDSLACDLFCRCKDDCVITIDRIFQSTLAMFGESVPDTALASLQAAAEYISGISLFSAESSYYATMMFAMLMGKAGSAFFPAVTQGTLDLIIALAADEPSNDWELLCSCEAPPTWRLWTDRWNTGDTGLGEIVEQSPNRLVVNATYGSPDPSGGAGYRINICTIAPGCLTVTSYTGYTDNVGYGCGGFGGGVPQIGSVMDFFGTYSENPHSVTFEWA